MAVDLGSRSHHRLVSEDREKRKTLAKVSAEKKLFYEKVLVCSWHSLVELSVRGLRNFLRKKNCLRFRKVLFKKIKSILKHSSLQSTHSQLCPHCWCSESDVLLALKNKAFARKLLKLFSFFQKKHTTGLVLLSALFTLYADKPRRLVCKSASAQRNEKLYSNDVGRGRLLNSCAISKAFHDITINKRIFVL